MRQYFDCQSKLLDHSTQRQSFLARTSFLPVSRSAGVLVSRRYHRFGCQRLGIERNLGLHHRSDRLYVVAARHGGAGGSGDRS